MAQDHSMDIVAEFDFQEIKNAIEMAKKETQNRFDLKDSKIEIELNDDNIKITAESATQIEAVFGIILKKAISRKVSPKVLKRGEIKEIGGMRVKEELKLIKSIDQESAKKMSKKIREIYPKANISIQGESLRVSSKSINELQDIIQFIKTDESVEIPLSFTNFR